MPNQEKNQSCKRFWRIRLSVYFFSFVKIIQYSFFVLKMMTVVQIKNYGSPFQVFTLPSPFQIKDSTHEMKCSLLTYHTKFDQIWAKTIGSSPWLELESIFPCSFLDTHARIGHNWMRILYTPLVANKCFSLILIIMFLG